MAEFWRRWHISLLQWFRDYIYIPLGGSRGTMGKTIANTIIVFTISGLWHGANWTFVAWGLLNALYLIPLIVRQVPKFEQVVAYNRWLPSLRETGQMVVTFGLVNISWVLFRAESVSAAGHYLHRMVSWDIFSVPEMAPVPVLILIAGFTCVEWLGRRNQYAIESIQQVMPRPLRWLTYSGLIVLIGLFAQTAATPFIYFQF